MIPTILKLFPSSPQPGDEVCSSLLEGSGFKLEHIQSFGDVSPNDFWYDQDQDEWVALIAGNGTLKFEGGSLEMVAGDAILIPAHLKHRVDATSPDATWIAIHFST